MFYGAVVWDPWLIVSQIVCLLSVYYLTLGVFMSILVGTRVSRMSLVYLFDFSTLTASTVIGWGAIASFLLASAAGAVYMLYLIERAKKCLDFSATIYIIHLFICIVYGGWPSSFTWWIVNVICIAVMALLGEWLCIRRELREIPITRLRSSGADISGGAGAGGGDGDEEEEGIRVFEEGKRDTKLLRSGPRQRQDEEFQKIKWLMKNYLVVLICILNSSCSWLMKNYRVVLICIINSSGSLLLLGFFFDIEIFPPFFYWASSWVSK